MIMLKKLYTKLNKLSLSLIKNRRTKFIRRNEDSLLNKYKKRRSEDNLKLVQKTINNLIKNNEKVSFASVASNSGLSRSYLYNNHEIRATIKSYINY